jgi:hypothetical protein
MTKTLDSTIQAHSTREAIAIVRKMHPDEPVIDAWESNDGYDVIVWATETDSVNDDGGKAIARYTITAGVIA